MPSDISSSLRSSANASLNEPISAQLNRRVADNGFAPIRRQGPGVRLRQLIACLRHPFSTLRSGCKGIEAVEVGLNIFAKDPDKVAFNKFLRGQLEQNITVSNLVKVLEQEPRLTAYLMANTREPVAASHSHTAQKSMISQALIVDYLFSEKAFDLLVGCAEQLSEQQCARLIESLESEIGWQDYNADPHYYEKQDLHTLELCYQRLVQKLDDLSLTQEQKKDTLVFLGYHQFNWALSGLQSEGFSADERLELCERILEAGANASLMTAQLTSLGLARPQLLQLANSILKRENYAALAGMIDCFEPDDRRALIGEMFNNIPPKKMFQALVTLYDFFDLTPGETANFLNDKRDLVDVTEVSPLLRGVISASQDTKLFTKQILKMMLEFSNAVAVDGSNLKKEHCLAFENLFKKSLKFSDEDLSRYESDCEKISVEGELKDFLSFSHDMGPNVAPQSLALWSVLEKPVSKKIITALKPIFSHQGTKDLRRKEALEALVIEIRKICDRTAKGNNPLLVQDLLLRVCRHCEAAGSHNAKIKSALALLDQFQILNTVVDLGLVAWVDITSVFRDETDGLFSAMQDAVNDGVLAATKLPRNAQNRQGLNNWLAHSRQPSAVLTYIASHARSERAVCQTNRKLMALLLESENAFFDFRYNMKHNAHLRKIARTAPGLIKLWSERGAPEPLTNYIDSELEIEDIAQSDNIFLFLREKILLDRHWPAGENILTLLGECDREAFTEKCDAILENYAHSDKEKMTDSSDGYTVAEQFERALVGLLSVNTHVALAEKFAEVQRVARLAKLPQQFEYDLRDLGQLVNHKAKLPAACNIVLSDAPDDLLLCGTEMIGSCQRVDGNTELNKGLQGYILDGKIKLLAVKSAKTGAITARRIARLLLDDRGQPVLHLDRLYLNPGYRSAQVDRAIKAYAEKMALSLGVPLVITGQSNPEVAYPLHGKGGPAPWEYVDAAQGLKRRGAYRIGEWNR